MMKSIQFLAFVLAFLAFAGAGAETPLRLGFVRMQTVIEQSEEGKRARAVIAAKVDSTKRVIDSLAQELRNEQENLEKKVALLSAQGVAEEQQKFYRRKLELQRKIDDQKLALRNVNDSELTKIVAEVDRAVAKVQAREGLDLILEVDPSTVIYFDPQYDLTQYVVEIVND